jgi:hypothetical protein
VLNVVLYSDVSREYIEHMSVYSNSSSSNKSIVTTSEHRLL